MKELDEDKDVEDHGAFDGYSLFTDTKVKTVGFYYDKFPYTVELSYKIKYRDYFSWPQWYAQSGLDAVEKTKYQVVIPSDIELRYWCNRDSIKPAITSNGSDKIYTWQAESLPALSKDAMGDDEEDYSVIVKTAPSEFSVDGHEGKMTSWKELGDWIYGLYKDCGKLPADAVNDVHALVSPEDKLKDKVKKLYNYMQNRSRYVSVQLGIGGWKPFSAERCPQQGIWRLQRPDKLSFCPAEEAGSFLILFLSTAVMTG